MRKQCKITEFDLLEIFTAAMDREGATHRQVRATIDGAMAEELSKQLSVTVTIEELSRLADKCLANEWLEHTAIGPGKYGDLRLTTTGFGVVRSRQRKREQLESRTALKQISDYIEDHKGLFVALGALLAIAGLLGKCSREIA